MRYESHIRWPPRARLLASCHPYPPTTHFGSWSFVMSHQTGIRANDKLRAFFGKCRNGDIRLVKVSIENEELTLDEYREPIGSWKEDYNQIFLPLLESEQPCFVLFRFDDKDDTGYQWLFISWSPDESPIREKMLYASTKATLKLEFGTSQIADEIFANGYDEISLSSYEKHKRSDEAPSPLTFAEEELEKIRKEECRVDISVDSKHQTVQGVAFPISDEAVEALFSLGEGKLNYVQLSIDLDKEFINLECTPDTNIRQLPLRIPKDHARYHLFTFPHTHEGDYLETIVFIYSMPGYDCSIKERMLYSSCKSPLISSIETKIGIPMIKRLEISEGKELTEEFMMNELHPTVNIYRQKFAKPKGPPNRGARRITKPKEEGDSDTVGVVV